MSSYQNSASSPRTSLDSAWSASTNSTLKPTTSPPSTSPKRRSFLSGILQPKLPSAAEEEAAKATKKAVEKAAREEEYRQLSQAQAQFRGPPLKDITQMRMV